MRSGALWAALAFFVWCMPAYAGADRDALQARYGALAVVDLDADTGTPRVLERVDGALSAPASGSAASIAAAWVDDHLADLGLSADDVVAEPEVTALPGGLTSVRWRQGVDGVLAADRSLRVSVAADGRVLNVLGSPAHDLPNAVPSPLSAGEAVRSVQEAVGEFRSLVRTSGASRSATYSDGTTATLVLFAERPAWRVFYRASDDAVYDSIVDADSGDVLRQVNMVKSDAPALVWERFPGSGPGGAAASVDLEAPGWLPAGAANLTGPNAHAYSDLDDNDRASSSEEVTRSGGSFAFPLNPGSGSGCDGAHLCSWTGSGTSWTSNRAQGTVEAFYLANRFHDHLAALGFDAGAGAFEGADRLQLNTFDGASTGPDVAHVNNASMFTPPDGSSPLMQMYLFRNPQFRNGMSGDDADVLFHEYTHGLSNRLITDAAGAGALNSAQAGAMGEAWSDWYAQDYIVEEFPSLDTSFAGEVSMGAYLQFPGGSSLRTE